MKRTRDQPMHTNWCFTYNNYNEAGEAALRLFLFEHAKYAIYGHETAPTTGTPHLQGFISCKKQTRTGTLQKKLTALGINLTLIYAKGSAKANRAYCTKEDPEGYFEFNHRLLYKK